MRRRNLLTVGGGKDYSKEYFTIVAKSNKYIQFRGSSTSKLQYSTDSGSTWSAESNYINKYVTSGQKVMFKGTCTPISYYGIGVFSGTTANFDVEGNIMSLLHGDDFKGQTSLSGKSYAFESLFSGCTTLQSAENLSLPATTLAYYCYGYMFQGCTSLTKAPSLLATTLAQACYYSMFRGCTSLTTAPELPATTLADACYYYMFYGTNVLPDCTNIDFSSPTVIARGGVRGLFGGTKLTDSQLDAILKSHGINDYSLPCTTLGSYCYSSMFQDCTSLETAPSLPATTLTYRCYREMFRGCTSLQTAPAILPATTLEQECYYDMFYKCTSLTTAPTLPATTLVTWCYTAMFANCSNLSSITCLATNISASGCTDSWVSNVKSTGTFTKASSMYSWTTGVNGIPSGWSVQNA